MKVLLKKYIPEFFVIVFSISISFYLEDFRQMQELKYLSNDLKVNLFNELLEIEKYLTEREKAFTEDLILLNALQSKKIDFDSILKLESNPSSYKVAVFDYRGFMPPVAFYKSLVNDGKIRYLESTELKEELDIMHNGHNYFITMNIKDESVAQKKVIDYFQINYPNLFVRDNEFSDIDYINKLKTSVDNDIRLKSIINQKLIAMDNKIVGFRFYQESLVRLKKLLADSIEN
jgi:hypothetical protein